MNAMHTMPTTTPATPRIGLALALLLALPACTPTSSEPAPARAPTPAPVAPSARPVPAEPAPEAPVDGRYTSLRGANCKTLELDDELGSTETRCAGVPPYTLVVTDSDARQHLAVIEGEGSPKSLEFASRVSAGFSELGDTVEWWPQGDAAPTALIVRFNAYEHPEQPDRTTPYLVVSKLGASPCVTEVIAPAANQNQAAREAAARAASAACSGPREY